MKEHLTVIKSKFSIERFQAIHVDQVKHLIDVQFGEDYLSIDELKHYAKASYSASLVALKGELVLGVSIAVKGSALIMSKSILIDQDWFVEKFKKHEPIALRKHMVVRPEYKGQGIGSQLLRNSFQILEQDCKSIITLVWKEGDTEAMHKLLQSVDCSPVKEIGHYWKKDSTNKAYICPVFKDIPCHCSAIVYAKFNSLE